MKLTLGYSPCPNDTFIFDALVNEKIDTKGLNFDVVLADVQTLNVWAMEEKLDITKISYGVLPLVKPHYILLNSGGALGKGVGPLLISRTAMDVSEINRAQIGVPGKNTTANLLFSLAFPLATRKKYLLFSEIESSVLNGTIDAGVIIHENRFTYQQRGLIKLIDLGEYWEQHTNTPIPLGGIVAHRRHDLLMLKKINALIRKSVHYAFNNYPLIPEYVKLHSQEMEESVMRQHIDLYVNDYSLSLGKNGKAAVKHLLKIYNEMEREEV